MANEQVMKQGGIFSFFKNLFYGGQQESTAAKPKPKPKGVVAELTGYTPAQQRELEYLCGQLFKKKSLITTGKLQLIGLEKVRHALGNRWDEQKAFVYKVAKDVINEHIGDGDIFVRMKDDTYLVIFSDSTLSQGNAKSSAIAEEIRKRLFASTIDSIRLISVKKSVVETRTKDFSAMPFSRALDFLASRREVSRSADATAALPAPEYPLIKTTPALPEISIRYIPLWDHKNNAITSYFCCPETQTVIAKDLAGDMALLQKAQEETARMAGDGRKFFVLCPVSHETLYKQSSFEAYKNKCAGMTEAQRRMLIIVLTDLRDEWKKANGFWFAPELKKHCQYLFLESSLGSSFDFTGLARMGFDAVGASVDNTGTSEQETMQKLVALRSKCHAAGIQKTFAMELSTLSMTMFAVCNGFDYLGGTAIHDPVSFPDGIHRYRYQDPRKHLKHQEKIVLSKTGTSRSETIDRRLSS